MLNHRGKAMRQVHHRLCEATIWSAFISLIPGAASGQTTSVPPGVVIPPPNVIRVIEPGSVLPSAVRVPAGITTPITPGLASGPGRVMGPPYVILSVAPPPLPSGFVVREMIPGIPLGPGVPSIPPGTIRIIAPPGG